MFPKACLEECFGISSSKNGGNMMGSTSDTLTRKRLRACVIGMIVTAAISSLIAIACAVTFKPVPLDSQAAATAAFVCDGE